MPKIKGSKFAQYESANIKGRRKIATNEWENRKFTVKQDKVYNGPWDILFEEN